MAESVEDELKRHADEHLASVLATLPADQPTRFQLFVEVVRSTDYWSIFGGRTDSAGSPAADPRQLDLMRWGWNMATAILFQPLWVADAFPLSESTQATRALAVGLLQELGKVSLIRRIADMARFGIVALERSEDSVVVRMSHDARAQFIDAQQAEWLDRVMTEVKAFGTPWHYMQGKDFDQDAVLPSAIFIESKLRPTYLSIERLDEIVKTMVRPWETGRGVMVAYDARIEIDAYFMTEAAELAVQWRQSAGMHPSTKFAAFTGTDFSLVMTALISLHSKHVHCVLTAAREFRQISVPQSLTIWGPRSELEESISLITGLTKNVIVAIFDVLAMNSEAAQKMAGHSTPLMPLLFDLGNGFVLRSVASLTRNPFTMATTLLKWSDPKAINTIAAVREEWQRSDLYGLFTGPRYRCAPNSFKLRRGSAVLTDVDAAVYDVSTGELAVFQLKWQDYSTNDVRQLRSKASNLSTGLEDWADAVQGWIAENGLSALSHSLKVRLKHGETIRGLYLFAVSMAVVRTDGYNVRTNAPGLAMATWPQFVRVRAEVGPSLNVFRDMHANLVKESGVSIPVRPVPIVIQLIGTAVHLQDFWNDPNESSTSAPAAPAGSEI